MGIPLIVVDCNLMLPVASFTSQSDLIQIRGCTACTTTEIQYMFLDVESISPKLNAHIRVVGIPK